MMLLVRPDTAAGPGSTDGPPALHRRVTVLAPALLVLLMVSAFLRTAQREVTSTALLPRVLVVLLLVVGVALAIRAVRLPRPGAVELLMLAYLAWVLLSLVLPHEYEAVDPNTGQDATIFQSVLRGVLLPFVVYLIARIVLVGEHTVRWLLWSVVGMTAYSAWVSIAPVHGLAALVWPRFIVDAPSWPGRAVGVFDQPVTNGLLLVIGIVVCLLLASRDGVRPVARVVLYGVVVVSTYAVYLTHTRAAVFGLVTAVVLGGLFARGWRAGFVAVGALGALSILSKGASTLVSPDRAAGGFGSPAEVYDRLNLAATAVHAIKDQPLVGIGLDRFAMYDTYQHAAWSDGVDWSRGQGLIAHENELGIAAEVGLPGLALWLAVLVAVAVLLHRVVRGTAPRQLMGAPLALTGGIAMAVMVVNGTTVDLRPLEFATMLPFVLAGAAVGVLDRRPASEPAPPPGALRSLWSSPAAPRASGRDSRRALAGGSAFILVAYVLGVLSGTGRRLDSAVLVDADTLSWVVRDPVHALLDWVTVPACGLVTAIVAIAYVRAGRRLDALRAVALVVGAEVLTQAVKLVLPRPGGENTLPSGHETLVAAVALVVVLAIRPARRRAAGVVAATVVVLAAVGTFVIGWHRPSDVVAALGVAAVAWGLCELALARLEVPGLAPPRLAPPRPERVPGPAPAPAPAADGPVRPAVPAPVPGPGPGPGPGPAPVPWPAAVPVRAADPRPAPVRAPVPTGPRGPGPTLSEVGVATVPLPVARPRVAPGRRLPETLVRLRIRDVAPHRPGEAAATPVDTEDRSVERHAQRPRPTRRRYAPAPGSRRVPRPPQRRGGRST